MRGGGGVSGAGNGRGVTRDSACHSHGPLILAVQRRRDEAKRGVCDGQVAFHKDSYQLPTMALLALLQVRTLYSYVKPIFCRE